jgi:transcriptional regulator with XRE-family HTH domain
MDQIKIGKFIAECRKVKGYTQASLAEQLHITNRAVSKWECGHSLPDAAIMLDLCKLLDITVTELLEGEKNMENNEELLIEMVKQKQEADKHLLRMEILAGIMASIPFIVGCIMGLCIPMEEWQKAIIVLSSMVPLLIAIPFLLRVEQIAGYYECQRCHHRYVPKYKSVFAAMHIGRARYMKCPECEKKSWQKKVLTKE